MEIMLCCADSFLSKPGNKYAPVDTEVVGPNGNITSASQRGKDPGEEDISYFPGMRRRNVPLKQSKDGDVNSGVPDRFTTTKGNALQEYIPIDSSKEKEMMAVTVPAQATPGETIHAVTPDGQTLQLIVPPSLVSGNVFYVEYEKLGPICDIDSKAYEPKQRDSQSDPIIDKIAVADDSPIHLSTDCTSTLTPVPLPPNCSDELTRIDGNKVISKKGLIAVTIPSNASPGQIIHVMAPDGQKIQTNIPSSLKTGDVFHVEYEMSESKP